MDKKYITKKKIALFTAVAFIFIVLTCLLISSLQIIQIKEQIKQKINFIQKDVKIKDGSWDLSFYNRDSQLVGNYPLYFFTSEGFVLDRRSPIPGYLDTSDFRRLLLYKKTQTVITITNQTRRIASLPIMQNGKPVAVIAVSYFDPQKEGLSEIDKKLAKNLVYLHSKIKIVKGEIAIQNFEEKDIDYDVSFVIVDSYNSILRKTNNINSIKRIPIFIDPSYLKSLIKHERIHIVYDSFKREYVLLLSRPLLNEHKTPIGVIIVGQSLSPILSLMQWFILGESILLILFSLAVTHIFFRRNSVDKPIKTNEIIFNEKKGLLIIGAKEIEIPYATNQYYLVQSLFTYPKKRFETDELLKRFGEDIEENNWRKVYDTMIKVNKKVLHVFPKKLILNQNKTYQLNPTIDTIKQST